MAKAGDYKFEWRMVMAISKKREKISDGIYITTIHDNKFNVNTVGIRFISKVDEKKASAYSLVTRVLQTTNSRYQTRTELTKELTRLYGAGISQSVFRLGDCQAFYLGANCICDRFSLDGEEITSRVSQILLDCIFSPNLKDGVFNETDFEIIKQELIDNINNKINDKRSYAIDKALQNVFENEPAGVALDGTVEELEKLNCTEAFKEYKEMLKTSYIEITVSGGGDFDDTVKLIKSKFGDLEREYTSNEFVTLSPVKEKVYEITEKFDVLQCKMVLAFKTNITDPEQLKLFALMFGGLPSSKLFANVREKLSLCYYCSANNISEKGVMLIDSGVELKNIQKAKDEILKQLGEMADGNFTDEELENAKTAVCGSLRSYNDSASGLATWWLTQLCVWKRDFSPEDAIEKYKGITREQIIEAAKSYKLDTVYIMSSNNEGGAE